jgi:hypothetical protein
MIILIECNEWGNAQPQVDEMSSFWGLSTQPMASVMIVSYWERGTYFWMKRSKSNGYKITSETQESLTKK